MYRGYLLFDNLLVIVLCGMGSLYMYLLFKICSFVHRLHTFAVGNKTIRIMKKLLFITALLCVTVAGFAKREKICLDDRSRSIFPLIEAYIDERILEFEISEDLGTLDILIEDISGNVIFSSVIDGSNGTFLLELEKGDYLLIITNKEHILKGYFCVE